MKITWCVALAAQIIISGCSNKVTTPELLNTNFIAKDETLVTLLLPSANSIAGANPAFSWTSKSGAIRYQLEISASNSFGATVLDKTLNEETYTLVNSDLKNISGLANITYYWRITVHYTDSRITSAIQAFHLLDPNIIYVNVAASGDQYGNKSFPYRTIQGGIEAANSLRGGTAATTFEIRVAQGTYNEEVNMKPGISIRGGYEATNWTRDYTTNVTTIIGQADSGVRTNNQVAVGYRSTTVIDGFHIRAGNFGSITQGIANFGGSPTISNNTISGGSAGTGGNNYGVYSTVGAQPLIINNMILGGTGTGSNFGVMNVSSGTNAIIWGNTINGGTAGSAQTGINFRAGGSASVRNNVIFNSTGAGNCISEADTSSDPSEVLNNNLFGCTTLYDDADTAPVSNLTTSIVGPNGTLQAFGNVSISNTGNQLFVNMNGPDGNVATMTDNDWHLTTSAAICNVRGGGQNLSSTFTTDKDGLARTISTISGCTPSNTGAANWSIGAYERD